jgi:hypothetical protein
MRDLHQPGRAAMALLIADRGEEQSLVRVKETAIGMMGCAGPDHIMD